MDNDEIKKLILKAVAGDQRAMFDLATWLKPKVWKKVYYMCNGKQDDAENVYQETLISVLDSLPTFRLDDFQETRFMGWVYTIINRRLVDFIRSKRKRYFRNTSESESLESALISVPSKELQPYDSVESAETYATIDRAMNELPEPERYILLLHVERVFVADIARKVNLRGYEVKKILHRVFMKVIRKVRETNSDMAEELREFFKLNDRDATDQGNLGENP